MAAEGLNERGNCPEQQRRRTRENNKRKEGNTLPAEGDAAATTNSPIFIATDGGIIRGLAPSFQLLATSPDAKHAVAVLNGEADGDPI
ncbi:unnamed protein product [Lactuca virosa]|uniref:Uncharacterized protein n=1 Tax=Lactuca virosa TaxID=75947 RepID=A0AAU9NAL8_9ASTR|nr:unnamed protein product [Lactuca virosa]